MTVTTHGELSRVNTFVGAASNQLRVQVRSRATGLGVDLTGYSTCVVSADLGSAPKIARRACTIEVGTDGWVNFTPSAAEIDTAGDYLSQLKLDPGTGDPLFPTKFIIVVEAVVDNA